MAADPASVAAAEHNLRVQGRRIDGDFLRFACAIAELNGSGFDWPYFLERPEKWAWEYTAWVAAGEPSSPDYDGWDWWAIAVEEHNS